MAFCKKVVIGLVLIGFLSACGASSVSSPAPVLLPTNTKTATPMATVTFTAPTPTEIQTDDDPLPTFTPFPWPVETAVPLSENDSLYLQLTQKGYKLTSSGSLVGPGGFTYSAHLFINTYSPYYYNSLNPATKETILVAFYRRDGAKDVLLGVQYLPPIIEDRYYGGYADVAGILNWNWDVSVQLEMLRMDVFFEPDNETRPLLKQDNFSSDINQNGLPEFAVVMQFCVCSVPARRIQLFEIQNTATVKNITQDLPGNTSFYMHTKAPYTFYVYDSYVMDYNVFITTQWIYAWDGSKLVDVSANYADEYMEAANKITNDFKARYGKSFDEIINHIEAPNGKSYNELRVLWFPILRMLKLYEKAGLQKEGLQVLLDITDISHWPGTSNENQCLLQLVRAGAQEDVRHHRKFDLAPSNYWLVSIPYMDKTYTASLKQAGYDLSACDLVKE